mgnify:CR=1 FL=1
MQSSDKPSKLTLPFANSGARNTIPEASQIGITDGAASLTDGFPPLTRTPIAAGGVPPSGLDMNGILYAVSALARWFATGGGFVYDSSFSTSVSGYPMGARVMRSDGLGYWLNTVEGNMADPEGATPTGWVPDLTSGIASITMTSANVTMTPAQYGKPIISITGTLTANLNLVFPAIIGKWIVVNGTSGAYTITCKTSSGTGIVLNPGASLYVYGDGTNINNAAATPSGVQRASYIYATDTGSANAYVVALTPAITVYGDGHTVAFKTANANTGASTLNAGGGVKSILHRDGSALRAGAIPANSTTICMYNSSLDAFVLVSSHASETGGFQIFGRTTSTGDLGTLTPSSGVYSSIAFPTSRVVNECWGGGGGGSLASGSLPGAGGGGGGYSKKRCTLSGAVTITIGDGGAAGTVAGNSGSAGGSSSFGSFNSASGGSGGYGASDGRGGAPGTGTGGDINLTGKTGGPAIPTGAANSIGGNGGDAPFMPGGGFGGTGSGAASSLIGCGGPGAGTAASSSAQPGIAGAIIVTW